MPRVSLAIRSVAVWVCLMVLAIANGLFREGVLVSLIGPANAHVASTLILCVLIALMSGATVRWIGPESRSEAWGVGGLWLTMTLAFELGFGRFVADRTWPELLADYDLLAGRIWPLVLLTVFVAPYLASRVRKLLRR